MPARWDITAAKVRRHMSCVSTYFRATTRRRLTNGCERGCAVSPRGKPKSSGFVRGVTRREFTVYGDRGIRASIGIALRGAVSGVDRGHLYIVPGH